MFLKFLVSLALLAICGATSCSFKNVLVDLSGDIVVEASDGQQVVIETDDLGSFSGAETIKVHITGSSGLTKTLQYSDEQVTHDGQRESDILSKVFSQFAGPHNEISFQSLKLTVLKLVTNGKANPIVLKALQKLSCQDEGIGSDIFDVQQQRQWQGHLGQNAGGNSWEFLVNQVGQPEVVNTLMAQAEIQKTLQQEAQLAKILQIKAQEEAETQAQLADAILEKEAEVQGISQPRNVFGNVNIGLSKRLGGVRSLIPFNQDQSQAVWRKTQWAIPQRSIIEDDASQRIQQRLSSLNHVNQRQQIADLDVVQQVAQKLNTQGVPYPQNVKIAQELVAQNSQQAWINPRQALQQTAPGHLSQLVGRTRAAQPFFV